MPCCADLINLVFDFFITYLIQASCLGNAPTFTQACFCHGPSLFLVFQDDIPKHGHKEIGWSLLSRQQDCFPRGDGLQGFGPPGPEFS